MAHDLTVHEIVSRLTLEEKCALLSGGGQFTSKAVPRLGIPAVTFSDGPAGVRRQAGTADHLGLNPSLPATCFPAPATLANSWDPQLEEEVGRRLGGECVRLGVDVLLAPGLNIQRSPLCGRNFEYFSEDPYLAGKMAAACIRGVQSQGVDACPKHLAANSQETLRMHSDSVVDERTLREIYLTNFEIAVKQGRPRWIMSAYNRINGVYANEDERLLRRILRVDWGFEGCVVTDWGGGNSHTAGVAAGSHLEMPSAGPAVDRELLRAVQEGRLSREHLDKMAQELLNVLLAAREKRPGHSVQDNHSFARRAAGESMVLLKNEGSMLPLAPGTRVAVVGCFAQRPRIQGGGSSSVNANWKEEPLDCLKRAGLEVVGFAPGFTRGGSTTRQLLSQAAGLAARAQTVVCFLGLSESAESEGADRTDMALPAGQLELLAAVAAANPRVAVVLSAGSPVELPEGENFRALLLAGVGGQAGPGAVADVLTGAVNPSGKLAQTWPRAWSDVPCAPWYPGRERTAEYREGLFVGYRYYTTAAVPVEFPFGFGLSYTSFAYSELEVTEQGAAFTLTNTGDRAGAEIAQLYVSGPKGGVIRPVLELKGFQKVWLEPGQSRRVTIPLDEYAFRYFNVDTGRWEEEAGDYAICVGPSCAQLPLKGRVRRAGTGAQTPCVPPQLSCYACGRVREMTDEGFAALLGHSVPAARWDRRAPLEENDTLAQLCYARSPVGRLTGRVLLRQGERARQKAPPDLNAVFRLGMPFRAVAKMTAGAVDDAMVTALLEMVNGRMFRGMGHLAQAWHRKNRADREGGNKA